MSIVWINSHFEAPETQLVHFPVISGGKHPNKQMRAQRRGKGKKQPLTVLTGPTQATLLNWQYTLLNWHNHVQSLTEGVNSLKRERHQTFLTQPIPDSSIWGQNQTQQQYFELGWASPLSYRKILSHRGGIYGIFYTMDGESRLVLEAGEYVRFQSIQRAQQGISQITFSSLVEGFRFDN